MAALKHEYHSFHDSQQAFQDKLRILREQRKAMRTIPDPTQREQAFHQIQAEYLHLQQAKREQEQLLREQQATYRQLRLDYEAQRALLRAEQPARQDRQEKRRWQGYGNA